MNELLNKINRDFVSECNERIKAALVKNGINFVNEQFLRDNLMFVEPPNDKFRHLFFHYGQSDQKRILSIEKDVQIKYEDNKITVTRDVY